MGEKNKRIKRMKIRKGEWRAAFKNDEDGMKKGSCAAKRKRHKIIARKKDE